MQEHDRSRQQWWQLLSYGCIQWAFNEAFLYRSVLNYRAHSFYWQCDGTVFGTRFALPWADVICDLQAHFVLEWQAMIWQPGVKNGVCAADRGVRLWDIVCSVEIYWPFPTPTHTAQRESERMREREERERHRRQREERKKREKKEERREREERERGKRGRGRGREREREREKRGRQRSDYDYLFSLWGYV